MTTSEASLQDLSQRVEALERRNARLRRTAGLAIAFAVFLPFLLSFVAAPTGGSAADELTARKFVLVDEAGGVRGEWSVSEKGQARLLMRDPQGKERVEIGVDHLAAMAILRDDQGRNRVGMAVDSFPHLMLHDQGEKPRLHMSVGKSGAPSLLFIDVEGHFPAGIGLKPDGSAWLKPEGLIEMLDSRKPPAEVPPGSGKRDGDK